MKDIIELLENRETLNLGLKLICKKYNFRIIKQDEYNNGLFMYISKSCVFITKYDIKTEQQLIYDSISRFKMDICYQHDVSLYTIKKLYTKSGHEKIGIAWKMKRS